MISKFTTIRWFHAKQNTWITDYINTEDDENHYVITKVPTAKDSLAKYKFVMPRRMVDDLYSTLGNIMKDLFKQRGDAIKHFKVTNLGVNGLTCNSQYVAGRFEILIQQSINQ